jgi:hypothetical protein
MRVFLAGVFVGIVLSTVGVGGFAKVVDGGVDKVKTVVKEQVKE